MSSGPKCRWMEPSSCPETTTTTARSVSRTNIFMCACSMWDLLRVSVLSKSKKKCFGIRSQIFQGQAADVVVLAHIHAIFAQDGIGGHEVEIKIRHQVLGRIVECREVFVFPVGKRDAGVFFADELFRLDGLQEIGGLRETLFELEKSFLRIFHGRSFDSCDARDAVLRVVGDALYLHENRELVENNMVVQECGLKIGGGTALGRLACRVRGGFVEYLRKRPERFHHRRDDGRVEVCFGHTTSTRVPNNPPKQRRNRRHDALRRRRTAT